MISKNKISSFLANVKGIRRSGSASNLAPPTSADASSNQAHSLPQTPNHSPSPSRKVIRFSVRITLVIYFILSRCFFQSSVFAGDVKLFQSEEEEDELEKALDYLLNVPKNEQFLESIKSSGKKLCMDLTPEKRETRINEMVNKSRWHRKNCSLFTFRFLIFYFYR